MRLRFLFVVVSFVAFDFAVDAQPASAQRLLQRLRDRIVPLLAPPTDPNANPLPQRPVPGAGQADPAGAAARRPSNYRNPGASRIPSTGSPTPAVGPDGVRQAGAEQPAGRPGTTRGSGFGKSILAPLDFGDEPEPQPAGGGTTMGIQAVNANPGFPGVQVVSINADSKADEGGLKKDDYIFAIDGVHTSSVRVLADEVGKRDVGDVVRLRIGRGGDVSDIEIELVGRISTAKPPVTSAPVNPPPAAFPTPIPTPAPRPADSSASSRLPESLRPKLGADFREVPGTRGVVVTSIQKGSIAESAGLKVDDRIVAVNGKLVADSRALVARLSLPTATRSVDLRVVRNNQLIEKTVRFDAKPKPIPEATSDAGSETGGAPDGGGLLGGLGASLGGLFGAGAPQGETQQSEMKTDETAEESAKPTPAEPTPANPFAPTPAGPAPEKTDDQEDQAALQQKIEQLRSQLKALESKIEE